MLIAVALSARFAVAGSSVKVYEEPGWCVWCPSAVALSDGRYALVHSRWRESDGFEAWCAKSEAALAISETGPLGPYRFSRTILAGSGRGGDFDRDVVHNPQVFADGGKYYLFYMGTFSDLQDGALPGVSSSGTAKGSFRMNQRIGVAVSDCIEGPYARTGKSILPESEDCIMASNPAVVKMPNGKYLMVYKWGWPPAVKWPHCRNSIAAAVADSPLGPWKVVSKDIFPVRCANFPGEDPCLWIEGDVICCSIHDNGSFYAASDRALIRFESRDGVNWKNCGELFPRGRISRLERPFVLAEPQGRRLLFAASKPGSASPHSEILAFPGILPEPQREFDLVVYGGTSAGLAAAIAAKRAGLKNVVVLEPTGRIGGLTTGGLGQTDIGVKWAFGGLSREFYRDIKRHYAQPSSWKWQKNEDYRSGGQSKNDPNEDAMWTFEPSAALAVLEGWEKREGLDIRRGKRLDRTAGKVKVEGQGQRRRIVSVCTEDGCEFRAKMFVDATYEGDLLAAAGVSYAVGREANLVYGETINGVQAGWHPTDFPKVWDNQIHVPVDPYVVPGDRSSGLIRGIEPEGCESPNGSGDHRIQAYCFRLCLTDVPENRIPFTKPEGYDERDYEILFRIGEAGEDLALSNFAPMPNRKTDANSRGGFSFDFVGGNWNYPEASYAERERIVRAHLKYQRGLLWTLANHPRIPAKARAFYSQWGTCRDEFVGERGDGWQNQLYIREARRMVGQYVMTEHDCRQTRTVPHPVALAAYGMDSHNVRRHVVDGKVANEGDVQDHKFKRPYSIEYLSLVPRRGECANLLVPVCLSASHIAYGSIRMEPVFFALGQVAGTAAAQAIADSTSVQDIDYARLRDRLLQDGQVVLPGHPSAWRVSVLGDKGWQEVETELVLTADGHRNLHFVPDAVSAEYDGPSRWSRHVGGKACANHVIKAACVRLPWHQGMKVRVGGPGAIDQLARCHGSANGFCDEVLWGVYRNGELPAIYVHGNAEDVSVENLLVKAAFRGVCVRNAKDLKLRDLKVFTSNMNGDGFNAVNLQGLVARDLYVHSQDDAFCAYCNADSIKYLWDGDDKVLTRRTGDFLVEDSLFWTSCRPFVFSGHGTGNRIDHDLMENIVIRRSSVVGSVYGCEAPSEADVEPFAGCFRINSQSGTWTRNVRFENIDFFWTKGFRSQAFCLEVRDAMHASYCESDGYRIENVMWRNVRFHDVPANTARSTKTVQPKGVPGAGIFDVRVENVTYDEQPVDPFSTGLVVGGLSYDGTLVDVNTSKGQR